MKKNILHIDEPFHFENGGMLESMDIVYFTSARPYCKTDRVVWVCHALTGNSDPSDWWSGMVGQGRLIDTDKYFVVCVSMIGSPYGMCCPATINPSTGKPYMLDFPKTTVRDIVECDILVRKHLGIGKIEMMIGPSIGGYQAFEWCVMEPDVISKAAFIATGARVTPYITAFNESQRMALLSDVTFMEQKDIHAGRQGLRCARSIALISYRSQMGYDASQSEKEEDTMFADRAASYQRHQGDKLVNRDFDAYSYWYLSYSLDSMNLGRGRGGVQKALESIKARCCVISITSDQVFPAVNLRKISEMLPDSEYHEIESIYGHDGFFIENEQIVEILKPLLDEKNQSL